MRKPSILAHRGAPLNAPENTIEAFRLAFENGADGIECDVRRTRDGEFVLFHDADTSRITGASGSVEERSYRDLSALRVMGREPVAHLDDLLELMSGRPGKSCFLDISLRGEGDASDLARKLVAAGLEGDLQILTFSNRGRMLRAAKRAAPAVGISVMPLTPVGFLETARALEARSICTGWNDWPVAKAWFRLVAAVTDLRGAVRRATESGIGVSGGVANTPEEVRWFADRGFSGIWTDDVPMARRALDGR
jgi:glycerophosphoryl diester phosphodiesterase